jgi:predicted metal-binding membrane protein
MAPTPTSRAFTGAPTESSAEGTSGAPSRTSVESLLLRDRLLVGGALAAAVALCWAWIVPMARDMYGPMTGVSAWMMTETWDTRHLALLFAMWTAMMAGMMLPSAAPALFLYGCVIRRSADAPRATSHVYAFAGGYLLMWTAYSLLATVLQRLLARWLLISPMMDARDERFGGALMIVAGIYQFTPFKRACLASCRHPVEFITRHWKPGLWGGFYLGAAHGLYCLGCCWALMMLLFVGGVMNLWWIAALTVFVLLEKAAPFGDKGGRLSGLLIAAAGAWTAIRGFQ